MTVRLRLTDHAIARLRERVGWEADAESIAARLMEWPAVRLGVAAHPHWSEQTWRCRAPGAGLQLVFRGRCLITVTPLENNKAHKQALRSLAGRKAFKPEGRRPDPALWFDDD